MVVIQKKLSLWFMFVEVPDQIGRLHLYVTVVTVVHCGKNSGIAKFTLWKSRKRKRRRD